MNTLPKCEKANIRVMSSNILFDKTAPEREGKLLENYMYYQPDLIGFQEVNRFFHDNLMVHLRENGYDTVKAWPDPEKRTQSELDSLSEKYAEVNFFTIAYKTDRFEEVESVFRMYKSTWTRTKGYTLAVFRDKLTGKLVAHLNTHAAILLTSYKLEGMIDSVDGAVWRADNALEMLEAKKYVNEKYGDIPMFFTGDFNGGEKEKYYSIITSGGMLDAKYIAKVSASVGLFSFHPVIGALPDDSRSPIDHIFVTPNVTVWVHSIERRQEVLDASDHCMVYVDATI